MTDRTEINLTQAVKEDHVFWDVVAEAMRLLGRQFDEEAETRNSISFRQRCANFEWAEQEVKRRSRAALSSRQGDKMIEAVAKALYEHEWAGQPRPEPFKDGCRDYWMEAAKAAIAAMGEFKGSN